MKTRKIALVTLLSTSLLGIVGCGRTDQNIDKTKTQLYVGYFDAGIGRPWIQALAADFEEAYKDYSFQPGKTGVQVIVDYDRLSMQGATLFQNISNKQQTVFVTEGVEYYRFASSNKMLPLDNVVNQKDEHYTDEKTIAEKVDPTLADYFKMLDGHFYALPYYEGLMGFEYDIDLFEKKLLFLKRRSDDKPLPDSGDDLENMQPFNALDEFFDPAPYFVSSLSEERSLGPDGLTGVIDGTDYSLDDGLPATFNEFYALQKQMVSVGVTPLLWCTNYYGYLSDILVALTADIEGEEQFNLNYTWNGTANMLIDTFDKNGNPIFKSPTNITIDNAYELQKSYGRYKSLEFAKNIVSDTQYYIGDVGFTHTDAQKNFINTGHTFAKDVGMLIDGVWWEQEGSANFSKTNPAETRLARKFGIMPMPKVDVATWEQRKGNTWFSENQSMCFINSNTPEDLIDISERFMRFMYTDAQMSQFTQITSIMRPLDYTMSEEDLANTSPYGRNTYAIRRNILSETCKDSLVYYYPKTIEVAMNENTVHKDNWFFSNSDGIANPIKHFVDNPKADIVDYFNKLYTAKKNGWNPAK